MAHEKTLKAAEKCLQQGEGHKALEILTNLLSTRPNPATTLSAAMLATQIKEPIPYARMKPICETGISIARRYEQLGEAAYITSRQLYFMCVQIGFNLHRQRSLTMMPRWFAFSLEREKNEYEHLKDETQHLYLMMKEKRETLLGWLEHVQDHKFKGFTFQDLAVVEANTFLSTKMTYLKRGKLFRWLKTFHISTNYAFSSTIRRELHAHYRQCIQLFEHAANVFRAKADEENLAVVLYNYALWMKIFEKFRSATRLARKARVLAEKLQLTQLLQQLTDLDQSIRAKNKDIPNYMAGETRPTRSS